MTNSQLRSVGLQIGLLKSADAVSQGVGKKLMKNLLQSGFAEGAALGGGLGGIYDLFRQGKEKGLTAPMDLNQNLKTMAGSAAVGGLSVPAAKYGPIALNALRKALRLG